MGNQRWTEQVQSATPPVDTWEFSSILCISCDHEVREQVTELFCQVVRARLQRIAQAGIGDSEASSVAIRILRAALGIVECSNGAIMAKGFIMDLFASYGQRWPGLHSARLDQPQSLVEVEGIGKIQVALLEETRQAARAVRSDFNRQLAADVYG